MSDLQKAEMLRAINAVCQAREAIVAHLGPWRKGLPSVHGRIGCPVCGTGDALAYRRAGSNGHIAAACATAGCVQWLE